MEEVTVYKYTSSRVEILKEILKLLVVVKEPKQWSAVVIKSH